MRRLLVLVSAIIFVDALLFTALTPLVPHFADTYDLSKTGAGLLVGAFGAGALLGGVIGGLAATRIGPKGILVSGLFLLGVASFAFATAGSAEALGVARFLQGLSSTTTWTGALAWLAMASPLARRGEIIGTAFGAAVFGAVLGPVFGGVAEIVGIRASFVALGLVAFVCTAVAAVPRGAPAEPFSSVGLARAFRDARFVGGLWLNTLPALFFGLLAVLAPLSLHDGGFSALGIAAVFFGTGLVSAILNPYLGRISDTRGRLLPIRIALGASIVTAGGLAAASGPVAIAVLVGAAVLSFEGFYTPGISLTSTRADAAGLPQALAFGVMNSAWALGELVGPSVGGALAAAFGDAVPYLIASGICAVTLLATQRVAAARKIRPA